MSNIVIPATRHMNDPTQTLWQVEKTNIICTVYGDTVTVKRVIEYNDGATTSSGFVFTLPAKPEHIWMTRMMLRQFHEIAKHQTNVTTFINEEFKTLFGKELGL